MPHPSATLTRPVWRPELEQQYAELGSRLERLLPCLEWPLHLPWIDAINTLKRQRGAVIMAHSYQSPEIFHGVADVTGDSLASSIEAADVRALRASYPDAPVVSYVNTSAAVKAESDACCTSANAVQVVESMGAERVIFLPDRFLGSHVASQTGVELVLWDGRCEVHEQFTAQQARHARDRFEARLVAHPECPPEVLAEADFVGSTTAMAGWLQKERPERVALITECSMADNLRAQFPAIEFIKPCNLCPHMKKITLPNIHACLTDLQYAVEVPAAIAARARGALQRMLAVGRRDQV